MYVFTYMNEIPLILKNEQIISAVRLFVLKCVSQLSFLYRSPAYFINF